MQIISIITVFYSSASDYMKPKLWFHLYVWEPWHFTLNWDICNMSPIRLCIADWDEVEWIWLVSIVIVAIGDGMSSKQTNPDSKVHGANMGPTWVLSAPDGPHVVPMNLAIREYKHYIPEHMDMVLPCLGHLNSLCGFIFTHICHGCWL